MWNTIQQCNLAIFIPACLTFVASARPLLFSITAWPIIETMIIFTGERFLLLESGVPDSFSLLVLKYFCIQRRSIIHFCFDSLCVWLHSPLCRAIIFLPFGKWNMMGRPPFQYSQHWVLRPQSVRGIEVAKHRIGRYSKSLGIATRWPLNAEIKT